jgi:hypothetical protein
VFGERDSGQLMVIIKRDIFSEALLCFQLLNDRSISRKFVVVNEEARGEKSEEVEKLVEEEKRRRVDGKVERPCSLYIISQTDIVRC